MDNTGSSTKVYSWLIMVVFCIILFVPLVLSISQADLSYSETEKRPLAVFPIPTDRKDLLDFPQNFDTYYQDHFGLRAWMNKRYHREMDKRFGITGVPDVVEGNEGWFYFAGVSLLDDFRGKVRFSDAETAQICEGIGAKRDWLAARNIHYLPLIAPNKQSIYPEYLPEHYLMAKQPTRLDQLLTACNTEDQALIPDLRPPLTRQKKNNRLYFQTDTHWNMAGAFIAYLELMRTLQRDLPDLDYKKQFLFEDNWQDFTNGDLTTLLGKRDISLEKSPVLQKKGLTARGHPLSSELQTLLAIPTLMPPMLDKRNDSKLRLLIFHDSFAVNLKPYLSENFAEVLYIWQFQNETILHSFNQELFKQIIEEFDPDIVIDEVVERHLFQFLASPFVKPESTATHLVSGDTITRKR